MFMIPKYRSGRSFARLAKTSVVCRRIAEANALPSAKRMLLIVVPSILSADTRFPAASTTTTAMFKFCPRVNAIAPSMMTRASASEMGGGAGVWASPAQLDAKISNTLVIAIVGIAASRRLGMGTSVVAKTLAAEAAAGKQGSAGALKRDFVFPHVGSWHKADIPVVSLNVRFRGKADVRRRWLRRPRLWSFIVDRGHKGTG